MINCPYNTNKSILIVLKRPFSDLGFNADPDCGSVSFLSGSGSVSWKTDPAPGPNTNFLYNFFPSDYQKILKILIHTKTNS